MNRYHTINTRTGEIVAQSDRHPLIAPLATYRPLQSQRTGLWIPKRMSVYDKGLITLTVVSTCLGCLCFWYALTQ